MRPAASLARRLVALAARRWPRDLAEDLEREWYAELNVLRDRPGRMLAFAASLAVSPTADGPTWHDRARAAATPVAVTLLAAALFNGVQLAKHHLGPWAAAGALAVAVAVMAVTSRRPTPGRVVLLGFSLYAFLLAGNTVAVMPFMGWRDVGPAIAVWTVLTALTLRAASSRVVAAVGTLAALDLAVAAGCLHAAATLGVPASSAGLWLPLSFLPGGAMESVPTLLVGNAAAMAGPMALCSAYVLVGLLRPPAIGRTRVGLAVPRLVRVGSTAAGITAALATVAAGELLRRSAPSVERLADNSAVFGFGFLAHSGALAATALLVAMLVAYRRPAEQG
ncbi:hypothetical protein AB0368_31920 [Actinoplanes sp. NPDC051475]|uniref:hypothetical protein n=1 Tax=Actinoplanes sp. NPDC051475 TaxID=3157225 RepID=UPI00344DC88D